MTHFASPSALICTDLGLGWQSGMDLSVSVSPIAESANLARTWNGRLLNLADEAFRLYAVRLSSGDHEMRAPALARLWPGTEFDLVPNLEFCQLIPPGAAEVALDRAPWLSGIRCLSLGFDDVPWGLAFEDGKTLIRLHEPDMNFEGVRVYYRPRLRLMVTEPWSHSDREMAADVSWELSAEETGELLS